MQNFTFHNPVKLVFGKGQIAQLGELVPKGQKVMLAAGGGSIRANGVYEQVIQALKGHDVVEFWGIEPNPRYETLMKAVEVVKQQKVGFVLAVGGGSVLDGVKFIAAAAKVEGADPWGILEGTIKVKEALPLGSVLTLPATGSEMNYYSVVSHEGRKLKKAFGAPAVYPQFSVLDPETTFTLPPRQTANGVVDAFAHTMEQYITYPADAPLQDRMAEAVLATLIEYGPKALAQPHDYEVRATVMWTATMALNGVIGVGVPQDWSTHAIGHELTALFGLDHAQTLAVVMPNLWRVLFDDKKAKLAQYAERVWGVVDGDEDRKAYAAIEKTEEFFRAMGVPVRLADHGITSGWEEVPQRLGGDKLAIGERGAVQAATVDEILALAAR